ncbi:MAG: anti-sigma factor [Planctomycetota bacterium]|nr:anti-sigma factor [Planctomycetota bacterium]
MSGNGGYSGGANGPGMSGDNGNRNGTNGDGLQRADASGDRGVLAALAAAEGCGLYAGFDPSQYEVESYELAAGAAFAAWPRAGSCVAPSDGFQERVAETVISQMTLVGDPRLGGHGLSGLRGNAAHGVTTRSEPREQEAPAPSPGSLRLVGAAGWLAAAALLAVVLRGGLPATPEPGPALDALVMALEAGGATGTPWADGGPAGEVVWSDRLNSGYMRIEGLATNDPTVSQYQLWIFRGTDPGAEPHPVDGGVFDVLEPGELIVPIDAKLDVGSAGLFAVTVERPGGVVVSSRERIVAVAVRG